MLRGNYLATVDEKGRVKIPADFLAELRKSGTKFYVTSDDGRLTPRVYPMKAWEEIEKKLAKLSSHNAAKQKFLARTNYYGQVVEADGQGRILDSTRAAGIGGNEGRSRRAGPADVPGNLEPRALRRAAQP